MHSFFRNAAVLLALSLALTPAVAAAQQNVLRNGPAPLAYHVEFEEMPNQGHRFFEVGIAEVGLEDAVDVAGGEGVGIRRLFQAHDLPEQNITLQENVKGKLE